MSIEKHINQMIRITHVSQKIRIPLFLTGVETYSQTAVCVSLYNWKVTV